MHYKAPAALAVTLALSLAACGNNNDNNNDGAQSSNTPAATTGNGVDRAFVAAMIPHHQSAVKMARIAQDRGQSTFVKKLAANIIRTQTAEISTMRKENVTLARAGIKIGSLGIAKNMMGMDMNTSTLKTADPFDAAFLKMMIPHHEGAVTMAKAERATGRDSRLTQLATQVITAQQKEISEMRAQIGSKVGSGMEHTDH